MHEDGVSLTASTRSSAADVSPTPPPPPPPPLAVKRRRDTDNSEGLTLPPPPPPPLPPPQQQQQPTALQVAQHQLLSADLLQSLQYFALLRQSLPNGTQTRSIYPLHRHRHHHLGLSFSFFFLFLSSPGSRLSSQTTHPGPVHADRKRSRLCLPSPFSFLFFYLTLRRMTTQIITLRVLCSRLPKAIQRLLLFVCVCVCVCVC